MNTQIQRVLDSTQFHMEEAKARRSGPFATRVLYSLVTVLARQLLSAEQQRQVETILELHEDCLDEARKAGA
jgi:hypothetical protein